MKKSVKVLSLFTMALHISAFVVAQSGLIPGNNVMGDVRKVIEDFPNHFANITGEMIMQNPQSTEYECSIKMNGTEKSTVILYASKNNSVWSWQGLVLTTEDVDEAKKKYKSIYDQLHNQALNLGSMPALRLKGVYDEPGEKKFASTLLSLYPVNERFKGLKVEILLQYELMEWKLKILVYTKEREDDERGKRIDN